MKVTIVVLFSFSLYQNCNYRCYKLSNFLFVSVLVFTFILSAARMIRCTPGLDLMNGFFVALFRRIGPAPASLKLSTALDVMFSVQKADTIKTSVKPIKPTTQSSSTQVSSSSSATPSTSTSSSASEDNVKGQKRKRENSETEQKSQTNNNNEHKSDTYNTTTTPTLSATQKKNRKKRLKAQQAKAAAKVEEVKHTETQI